jgi:hypothetical protein
MISSSDIQAEFILQAFDFSRIIQFQIDHTWKLNKRIWMNHNVLTLSAYIYFIQKILTFKRIHDLDTKTTSHF